MTPSPWRVDTYLSYGVQSQVRLTVGDSACSLNNGIVITIIIIIKCLVELVRTLAERA